MRKALMISTVMILACGAAMNVKAQISRGVLEDALSERIKEHNSFLSHGLKIKEFYAHYQHNLAWITNDLNRQYLVNYLERAADLGLSKHDYQFSFIQLFVANRIPLATIDDSIKADLRFTDAAVHFFNDVVNGNQPPQIGYNGLNYYPDCINIPQSLASSLTLGRFYSLLEDIEDRSPAYIALKARISTYNKIVTDTVSRKDFRITSTVLNDSNKPLVQRLFQLGIIESPEASIPVNILKEKLKVAQRLFGQQDDGILRPSNLEELNVSLASRIKELARALNTVRWLRCIKERSQETVVVNIPSAGLIVYRHSNVILESKVIVGKRSTRTPIFCSSISEVVLYPYWMVPKSIATKELLPAIKRNIGYLEANNFQVVNEQGRIMNPSTINWQGLSTTYFPYTLRQSTGCDNSLGLVKFNFYSPYGVYLHDTPGKAMFNFNKRYFSHGCIRVEKAFDLGHVILKGNRIAIDTLEEKGCLRNQKPVPVAVPEKVPVFVLYNTAWIDSSATVRFYEDVYKKFADR